METHYDVIVVGGGAIGCASAWRLSQSGYKVLVLEKGQLVAEASSAAAGMLGAQMEMHEDGPMFRMGIVSRGLYPEFAEELFEETGIHIGIKQGGILRLAPTQERVHELHARAVWQTAAGAPCVWMEPEELRVREPNVESPYGAMYFPDDGSISAPLLGMALASACQKTCDVMEGTLVEGIVSDGSGVSVRTIHGTFSADKVVIAAGAWAKTLLADVGVDFPVYPVKGQILSVRPRRPVLSTVVFTDGVYVVPKPDGTLVIGATEEHTAGFDRAITTNGLTTLLENAQQIIPALKDATFQQAWVGIRPGTPTGSPLIGALPDKSNIILAAGHFRNGVLLTPVTAHMIAATVNGTSLPEFAGAFIPQATRMEVAGS